ncbi:MAG: LacI family DNA-binding transcriptional regulator [bacterium]|nr:LacI family DNA-binding transcriptional regulator [bacterium]
MTTIKQVAHKAGVSIKTVSRVLNNDPNVSSSTRAQVQRVIDEMGYRPNFAARHMRTQRSQVLGLITDEIVTTPFAVGLIRGAQDTAWAHNKMLLIASTNGDSVREQSVIQMMLERRVEGIIYAAWYHREVAPPPALSEAPAVLVDCFAGDGSLPSIVPDEAEGGYTATDILLRKGHRRVGFINITPTAPAAVGRMEGYCKALADHGLAYDEALVRYAMSGQANDGYQEAHHLLDLADPPTAIFCGNDRVAMGTYDALKERGLRIPDDVAVIGFDNQEIIAAYLRPALSTLELPHYVMGQKAVQFLLSEPTNGATKHAQIRLPCPYIERASV